jgi:hypothetical protein
MQPRPNGWLRPISCVLAAVFTLWLSASVARAASPAPSVTTDGDPRAGYVTVHWEGADLEQFQVELSTDPNFDVARRIYEGFHSAKVLSGLPDGTRYFRVRGRTTPSEVWGPWSDAARFDVKHHSLALAITLFVVGAAVFGATAAFLLRMSREVDDA